MSRLQLSEAEDGDPDHPRSGAPSVWNRPFVELVGAQALFGFAYATFLLLPKLLAVGCGANAREIGFVMAAFGVVSLATIPVVGPTVARLGRRRTLIVANLLLAGSALAFVLVTRAGLAAALLRGLHGVAWSLFFAAGMSLVADTAPPARLGQAIGLFGGASLAMNAIAPAVAEPIAAHFGGKPVFVLSAAMALAGAWFCRRLPAGVASVGSSAPANSPRPSAPELLPVFVVLAVGGLAAAGMFTFVAPFALGHGIATVRGFFIAYTVTALGVRLGGARLTDWAGHRRSALAGGVGYGAVVVVMGLWGPSHLALIGAAFGVAHGIVFPAVMALILQGASSAVRPRLLALANGAINLGIVGVGLLGAAAGHLGYPAVFVATGAVTFASALLLLLPARLRARASASST
jgi:predicted MFS family arabinose efflux permease